MGFSDATVNQIVSTLYVIVFLPNYCINKLELLFCVVNNLHGGFKYDENSQPNLSQTLDVFFSLSLSSF